MLALTVISEKNICFILLIKVVPRIISSLSLILKDFFIYKEETMKRIKIKAIFRGKEAFSEQTVTICGWVRTNRAQAQFGFLNVNDGSFFENIQVVYDNDLENFEEVSKYRVGVSVQIEGIVKLTPELKQPLELHAKKIVMLGDCPENYPIQPKRHTKEFLREVAHLRPRTNLFSAVFRIRSVAAQAIHTYFQERGYVYVNTPLITCADCEGSDQMFKISTLDFKNIPYTEEGKYRVAAADSPHTLPQEAKTLTASTVPLLLLLR